ncbi:MAG: winged helix-turn-helix transcriptional regulator [Patescibacteria group bacterium]|nr:winged helix-turn-helix transcriptional regulator [Patescibacteria group bacterium]
MKTDTSQKIIGIIRQKGEIRPDELIRVLGLSRAAVHKQLKKLVAAGKLRRLGRSPLVYYFLAGMVEDKLFFPREQAEFLEKNYFYVTPQGELLQGVTGFGHWLGEVGKVKEAIVFARRYKKVRQAADQFMGKNGLIELSEKLKNTYPKVYLNRLYCLDWYSLPEFGKTNLGQMVLFAKQSQSRRLIRRVAEESKNKITQLIKDKQIDALVYVPHSLPRQIQFLAEYRRCLNLNLTEIKLEKIRTGEVIVAQKSLNKLSERVINARETIMVAGEKQYEAVLLIDDAVGSGATLNETAKKLKDKKLAARVYGFALVSSFKGFDVIREL